MVVENYLRCLFHITKMIGISCYCLQSLLTTQQCLKIRECPRLQKDLGWQTKTSLHLISGKAVPVQSMNDFKEVLKSSWDGTQFFY